MRKWIFVFIVSSIGLFSCSNENIEIYHENGSSKLIGFYIKDTSLKNKLKEVSYYPSGIKKSEIEFKLGQKNGKFEIWFESGNLFQEGKYKEGIIDGIVINYFDESGHKKQIERYYKDGSLATEIRYYKNGTKMEEANYKDKAQYGKYTVWYPNGSKDLLRKSF